MRYVQIATLCHSIVKLNTIERLLRHTKSEVVLFSYTPSTSALYPKLFLRKEINTKTGDLQIWA